jgi:hypothetical protein
MKKDKSLFTNYAAFNDDHMAFNQAYEPMSLITSPASSSIQIKPIKAENEECECN